MTENEKKLKIKDSFFDSKNPLIIAELGTSHNGNIAKARQMVDAAAGCGAGCIKVQMVYADEILHPNTGEVLLPTGLVRLYDQFKKLEMNPDFYIEIKEYTESRGLIYLCTPFGMKSASILRKMQPEIVKIASPELNFTGLLKDIAGWNLPTLVSTGVSKLGDIEKAVDIFRENNTENCLCLLHCVTSYPALETEYNLRVLVNLTSIFGVAAGISDHSIDAELIPSLSLSMGAAVIEKHFCLSRDDKGLDDPIALPPDDFSKMVKAVQKAIQAGSEETISYYSRQRGSALVEQILGDGVKKLAPGESANYGRTNRSIHALKDIQKGQTIKREDYAILRTEKVLRPGLEPCWEGLIDGRAALNFIPAGEGIRFEDI
jgi:sialic acid synthase SpsE